MSSRYIVPAGVLRARADKMLAAAHPEHSRTALQRAFTAGAVTRAGVVLPRDATVSTGDELEFSFPEVRSSTLHAVDIPLEVLYEDKDLVAVNKPTGMVVHPGAATKDDTLVHALLAHCAGELSGIGGVERPGIVHRLDRETSGIILVAKNDLAHRGLASQFSQRSLKKEYLALVVGAPELLSGSIRKPIGRNPQHRHKMGLVPTEDGGRDAHTDWEVVERYGSIATLVRCTIHTGRTHQIRVHLKSLGHGILGDVVYGWKPDPRMKSPPARVMLHAEHLIFAHPVSGKILDLRAPVPADFRKLLDELRRLVRPAQVKAKRKPARSAKK